MDALTINEAAETTGWSPRMLRYVERVGLVAPARSAGGYRLYGAAELQRLRTLRELLAAHGVGLSDLAFAKRLRRDGDLRSDGRLAGRRAERPEHVPAADWLRWEQDKHEAAARRAGAPQPHLAPWRPDDHHRPDPDYKVADIGLADFGRKEIELAEHEMPGLMATARRVRRRPAAQGRAHHGLAAHDDPDRGADRDARCARRRGPLVLVQHLLHPGPRRGGHRRGRHPRLRLEGRDAGGVLVVHRAGAQLAEGGART